MKRFDKLILFSVTFSLLSKTAIVGKATIYIAATQAEIALEAAQGFETPPGFDAVKFEGLHSHGDVVCEWRDNPSCIGAPFEVKVDSNPLASLFGGHGHGHG